MQLLRLTCMLDKNACIYKPGMLQMLRDFNQFFLLFLYYSDKKQAFVSSMKKSLSTDHQLKELHTSRHFRSGVKMKINRSTLLQWTIAGLLRETILSPCYNFVDKNVLGYHLEFAFKDI